MESNSQWDHAQADWRRESTRRHQERSTTERYADGHRRALEEQKPNWEPVEDGLVPDYENEGVGEA